MIYLKYAAWFLLILTVGIFLLECWLFRAFAFVHAKHAVQIVTSWIVDFIGLVMVAIALCFRDPEGRLPWWAWPWNNAAEPFGDTERSAEIQAAANGWIYLWLRWHWLVIRNPGNNFGYWLGFTQAADVTYTYDGEPDTGDQSRPGTLKVKAWIEGKMEAFCYYHISKPYWFFGKRCLRVYIGNKINDMQNDGKKAQLVFVINPFMTYEGR